ncbi:MAG: ferritin family protein [Candidatus Thermoplasmatota archaeon]|nr:ferritin family protein [Candidatus Thermoplasmatota archaeon]MBU4070785.1 ferritin family protein [Candidatus Thermoplasmatota archaeon]MBU4144221.1 ferritin family protein [Candidatus Thermoplasmatota archaeon]MBU4590967.1 ferritin family protein [Candidatus Thermoplasmatota archaeon]
MNADMKKKLNALTMKEILGYSIHSEDIASTFYWTLAKVFDPNDLVKAKFLSLSNDEKLHKEALLSLHRSTFGNDKYVIPKGLPPFESVAPVKTVGSFTEALETGMENERNAHDIYMYLAKEFPENRKLFKYLAKTEMGHYETLKQDYHFFQDEFKDEPNVKLSQVYASTLFRPLDIEK